MKSILNKKTVRLTAALLIGGSFSFYSVLASEKRAEPETDNSVVVIVNSENEIHHITSVDLKRIYLGKINHWGNGETVQKATLKKGARIQELWLSTVLKMTEREFQQIWLKNIFTGKGEPPESFTTLKKVIEFVSANTGAIGYISEADSLPESVKTITFNGSNQFKKDED